MTDKQTPSWDQTAKHCGHAVKGIAWALLRRGMNPPATQQRPINGAEINLARSSHPHRWLGMSMRVQLGSCILVGLLLGGFSTPAHAAPPAKISLTWLSIANWLIEVGETRVMTDGYITRLPASTFSGPSFAFGKPSVPDTAAIEKVIKALDLAKLDYIFTGHSHFDHSFDTAVWAKLTGAQIVGARSTCLQAVAQGIPESQCTTVEGGEVMSLSDGLTVRVVRWNHSGDVTTTDGRLLHSPLELRQAPTPVPDGGLRPGILEDFPNGGGARAYLFTAQTTAGPVHWFYSNTGNAVTFSQPAKIEAAFFTEHELTLENLSIADHSTSAREHLQAALSAAGLDRSICGSGLATDLWPRRSTKSSDPRPISPTIGMVCLSRFLMVCRMPTAIFPRQPAWPSFGRHTR